MIIINKSIEELQDELIGILFIKPKKRTAIEKEKINSIYATIILMKSERMTKNKKQCSCGSYQTTPIFDGNKLICVYCNNCGKDIRKK